MISQLQNLRAFVTTQLADVVVWERHVRIDETRTTGDQAYIAIATDHNRYKMSALSAYVEPPAGAPFNCRSLGTITFDDAAGDKHVVGPRSDDVFTDICRHIHVRELTDALAAARRDLAEASGNAAEGLHRRLADLAEQAKKWGIDAKVPAVPVAPQGSVLEPLPIPGVPEAQVTVARLLPDAILSPATADPDAPRPFLGCPIIFITHPGEGISGMEEIPGVCVKVERGDRIAVFLTPDHSEPSHRDNLPRRGSPAGNGLVHRHGCWDFSPPYLAQLRRAAEADKAIAEMKAAAIEDRAMIDELLAETKRLGDRILALEGDKPKARKAREPDLVAG